jgi:hypothetical protein
MKHPKQKANHRVSLKIKKGERIRGKVKIWVKIKDLFPLEFSFLYVCGTGV